VNPREAFKSETGEEPFHKILRIPNPDYVWWLEKLAADEAKICKEQAALIVTLKSEVEQHFGQS
jgi:hypothetical protein